MIFSEDQTRAYDEVGFGWAIYVRGGWRGQYRVYNSHGLVESEQDAQRWLAGEEVFFVKVYPPPGEDD